VKVGRCESEKVLAPFTSVQLHRSGIFHRVFRDENCNQDADMRRRTEGFRKLLAWQEAKALTLKTYRLTRAFPSHEQFHLVSQLRRASSSIMANLAEGSEMPTKAHRNAYYARARGSSTEVDNHVELSFDLQYVTLLEYEDIADHCARLAYLIKRLIDS
jgi:four helix bundle protein